MNMSVGKHFSAVNPVFEIDFTSSARHKPTTSFDDKTWNEGENYCLSADVGSGTGKILEIKSSAILTDSASHA
jgi:hypothetical protein